MVILKACVILGFAQLHYTAYAQSLIVALSAYPQLSNFTTLLTKNPNLAASLLKPSASDPKTLLIPDNGAFLSYEETTGEALLAQDILEPLLQYHTLSGLYTEQDFNAQTGITVPTALTGPTYNNRTAGTTLSSGEATSGSRDGQVLFIAPNDYPTSFAVRQLTSPTAYVQSGLAHKVNLTVIDGTWDGGRFHIVDGFLTLPEVCTKTIRSWGLSYLDASLNRTNLGSVLDHAFNVTCLGPSDEAFLAAGSPHLKLNESDLTNALLFHTLPQPLYTNFLVSGQTFTTLNNNTIKVTINDEGIFFNDAKLTQANVITNNGLMHVLNKVMSSSAPGAPGNTTAIASASQTSTGTSLSTGTPNPTATTSSPVQSAGSAAIPGLPTPAWRLFELMGLLYGYLLLVV